MKKRIVRLCVDAAFLVGAIIVFAAASSFDVFSNFFSALAAIIAMSFVATTVHEIGHAWMAKKRGAEVEMIAVFPFGYSPRTRTLALIGRSGGGDIAGFVEHSFPDDCGTRKDEMAIAAAGPGAEFVFAAVLILSISVAPLPSDNGQLEQPRTELISPLVERPPPKSTTTAPLPSETEIKRFLEDQRTRQSEEFWHDLGHALVRLLIVISVVSGVLNLMPFRGSDGSIILQHLRWK